MSWQDLAELIQQELRVNPALDGSRISRALSEEESQSTHRHTADVYVGRVGDRYHVVANDDVMPTLKIRPLATKRCGTRTRTSLRRWCGPLNG